MSWEGVVNFTPKELNAPDPELKPDIYFNLGTLAEALQSLRNFCNNVTGRLIKIRVNGAYKTRGHSKGSQHYKGLAADIVIIDSERGPLPLFEQYELARRHGLFRGIGTYPHWATPGLHVDLGPKREWWSPKPEVYLTITKRNYEQAMGIGAVS